VLAQDDFRGEIKGPLSSSLAEFGELDDMAAAIAMIRADITRVREGRAAMARGERSARAKASPMSWSPWHLQAHLRLGHIHAEATLLDLLNESEYELDAAWALQLIAKNAALGLEWSLKVRQPVEAQFSLNGEKSHESVSKEVH